MEKKGKRKTINKKENNENEREREKSRERKNMKDKQISLKIVLGSTVQGALWDVGKVGVPFYGRPGRKQPLFGRKI